jgi:DNA polymerase
VTWRVREAGEAADAMTLETPHDSFSVPAKFVELARLAILHRAINRFVLLYRLLWRLCRHHDLLTASGDSDVAEVLAMADEVQRDIKSMQAGLRFREIGREPKARFVAWSAPVHRIVAAAAPFFASRFADMPWSILTPDACAHWDGHAVTITPGIAETPDASRLEETWQRYCADIVNPAGLKTRNQPPAPAVEPREPSMIRKPVSRKHVAAASPPPFARKPPTVATARSGRTRRKPCSAKVPHGHG